MLASIGGLALSVLWYLAGTAMLASAVALIKPLGWRPLSTRRAARRAVFGSLVALVILAVPSAMTTVSQPVSELDRTAPAYNYVERHARHVDAPPERVRAAAKAVTANEIFLFRTFTWIRRFGQPGPESILNAADSRPLLDVALESGFVLLADTPQEIVFGAIVLAPASVRGHGPVTPNLYRQVNAPGFVKATMNFRIEPGSSGSLLTTETRVFGTDTAAILRFTPYWRTILPGSWILRVTWLNAIARRAESGTM